MAVIFRIYEQAQAEFEQAVFWYESKSKGLGERFAGIILKKFSLIEKFPERYPIRKKGFRETPVSMFPFIIVYKYYRRRNEVVVYRVFNRWQNPSKKYKSKK